jgi:transcriptional regulator with XRE-family HTH domain
MNVEIAQRLADLRRSNGLSQEALAERLGLSRQAISKWERAESSPDTDNLIALARLYGTSLDALLAVEPTLEDDIAFEAQDRAKERGRELEVERELGRGRPGELDSDSSIQAGVPAARPATVASATAAAPSPEPAAAASASAQATDPPAAPSPEPQQYSSCDVDADGCYLDDNGKPYRRKSKLRSFPFPIIVVAVYFIITFIGPGLQFSWLIFLTIPIYYWIVKLVEDDLNRQK